MAKQPRINTEYLNLAPEVLLLWRLALAPRPAAPAALKRILIVVPCLIGEFAATVPAIADFITRHKGTSVDLMVAPSVLTLAQQIIGIGTVYATRSSYGHDARGTIGETAPPDAYDLTIVIRMSPDAFRIVRGLHGALQTSAWPMTSYGLHLFFNILRGRTPRQWYEFNFALLGGRAHLAPFVSMVTLKPALFEKFSAHPAFAGDKKKIIVHTGSSWPMKHWDTQKWITLLQAFHQTGKYQFIFVGGGQIDTDDYAAIAFALGFTTHSFIGELTVAETVAALRLADGFIGIDSGPANLARLAELPSVTLYGPGPHMYLPFRSSDIAIDKTHGRGLLQMFLSTQNGFIHQITAEEAAKAFDKLVL